MEERRLAFSICDGMSSATRSFNDCDLAVVEAKRAEATLARREAG